MATNDAFVTTENSPPTIDNVITHVPADSDIDTGDTFVVVAINDLSSSVGNTITLAKGAKLTVTSTGAMTYDPSTSVTFDRLRPGQSDTDSFTYTIRDNRGGLATATVSFTINGVNDAPRLVNDSCFIVNEGDSITINVLANDVDIDGTLAGNTVALSGSPPSRGTLRFNANGSITYTAGIGSPGTDTFQYTVNDDLGLIGGPATVSLTVKPIPSPCQNQANTKDVNNDTFVSPLDALIIINDINRHAPLTSYPIAPPCTAFFLDVDGSRTVEPLDALIVINEINSRAGGEGEAAATVQRGDLGGTILAQAAPVGFGDSVIAVDHRWNALENVVVGSSFGPSAPTVATRNQRDAACSALSSPSRTASAEQTAHALAVDNLFDLESVLDDIVGNVGSAQHETLAHDRIFAGGL